jgi:hypothetical protein
VSATKLCENCGDPATHTGSHREGGSMLVCYPCTVGQQFGHLVSLEERDKRVRKFLDSINKQDKEVQG